MIAPGGNNLASTVESVGAGIEVAEMTRYTTLCKQQAPFSDEQVLELLLARERLAQKLSTLLLAPDAALQLANVDQKLREIVRTSATPRIKLREWRDSLGDSKSWWWSLDYDRSDFLGHAVDLVAAVLAAVSIYLFFSFSKTLWDVGEGPTSSVNVALVQFGTLILTGGVTSDF